MPNADSTTRYSHYICRFSYTSTEARTGYISTSTYPLLRRRVLLRSRAVASVHGSGGVARNRRALRCRGCWAHTGSDMRTGPPRRCRLQRCARRLPRWSAALRVAWWPLLDPLIRTLAGCGNGGEGWWLRDCEVFLGSRRILPRGADRQLRRRPLPTPQRVWEPSSPACGRGDVCIGAEGGAWIGRQRLPINRKAGPHGSPNRVPADPFAPAILTGMAKAISHTRLMLTLRFDGKGW